MEHIFNEYKNFLEQLNNETEGHCLRVAEKCKKYAKAENVNEELAYKVGLLHDIGKIFIPSRILRKNANLTILERQLIDLHAYFGYKMLKDRGETSNIFMPTLYHHGFGKRKLETVNDPLNEEEIKLIRLVHSIDVLDAMTQKRVYHDATSIENVLNVLENDKLCDKKLFEEIKKYELS